MDEGDLPFKVGQDVEARSFLYGYRGAWFRCKVREIGWKQNFMGHALEYCDFPDEKIRWTRLYQKHNRYDTRRHLMVRPKFPPVYCESELPDAESISEAVVVINDVWKVGDLVDWWTDGCYWSGRLAEKLGEEKFQVELLSPPDGEGLTYEASSKDFRPSLHWSAALEWTVPIPKDGGNCTSCARLILPVKHGRKDDQVMTGALQEHKGSHSSQDLASSLLPPGGLEQRLKEPSRIIGDKERELFEHGTNLHVMHSGTNKSSYSNRDSSLQFGDLLVDLERNGNGKVNCHDAGPSKKRTDGSISLSSMSADRNVGLHGIDASMVTVTNADVKNSHCCDGPSKKKSDGSVLLSSMCSDKNSSLHVRDASVKIARDADGNVITRNSNRKDNQHDDRPSQKMGNGGISLNSMHSDTIEAAILDLEELVNRVKWLKNILEFGMPLSNSERASWKFVQHRGPSITK